MKRTIYQLLFIISVIFFLFSSFFTVASAENIDGGTCGENLTWELDDEGTLTISGTGDMNISMYAPWYANCESINKVKLVEGITSVGNYAFRDCTNLKEIEIPKSVLSIGDYAFEDCISLTQIILPDEIIDIGIYAFRYCTSLSEINIPNNVTVIKGWTFELCKNLESITLGANVTTIEVGAFNNCKSLINITIPDSVVNIEPGVFRSTLWYENQANGIIYAGKVLYDCKGKLPENSIVKINEGARAISAQAFYRQENLIDITIPDSIETIEYQTFFGCSGLTSVSIPDSIKIIGNGAFSECTGLKKLDIGNGVTIIEAEAFSGCSNLTSVMIPNNVESLVSGAFDNCINLNTIYWNIRECKSSTPFSNSGTESGSLNVIFGECVECIPDSLFLGCEALTSVDIPSNVKSIGEYAFYDCTGLTNITISNGVTNIGRNAFKNCLNLTSFDLPESLEVLGEYVFSGCNSLNRIYWNAENLVVFDNPRVNFISHGNPFCGAGAADGNLEVIFGQNVSEVPENALRGCENLKKVTLSNNIAKINTNAFYSCTLLREINLPDNVVYIGDYAFSGCKVLRNLEIPDSVNYLGYDAFSGCEAFTKINIPAQITEVNGFSGCIGITKVIIPNTVTKIGGGAFSGCANLKEINISSSVTQIERHAFQDCVSLENIIIPENITLIGYSAFKNCVNLKNVYWNAVNISTYQHMSDASVHEELNNPFYNAGTASQGFSVTFQNMVQVLPENTFNECLGLKEVFISESVLYIPCNAFDDCENLMKIYVSDENKNYSSLDGVLYDKDKTELLLYPIQKDDEILEIPKSVISSETIKNSHLKILYIPQNLSSINFSIECFNLTEICVERDSAYYFSVDGILFNKDKTKIIKYPAKKEDKQYFIPETVTEINDGAFAECTALECIGMPETLTTIGNEAFNHCTNLKSITIPKNVKSMGNAFRDCKNIVKINYDAENIENEFYNKYSTGEEWRTRYYQPFYNVGIEGENLEVIFGEKVKTIPAAIFYGCDSLKSITLSNGIENIEFAAFENCSQLEGIYFLGSAEEWSNINIENNNTAITNGTIHFLESGTAYSIIENEITNCISKDVVIYIPEVLYGRKITSIKSGAFSGCKNLEEIIVPDTIIRIDASDFSQCLKLEKIEVSENHLNYSSLDGVLFNKDKTVLIAYPIAKQSDYVIPDTVTEIKADAFKNSTGLKSVTLHKNINKIEDYAFVDCLNLKYIYWNAENVQNNHPGVEDIYFPNVYFKNVGSLCGGCEVIFGDTVETIPQYTFYNCEGLKKVTISDSVNSIGYRAFQYCEDLESIDVSDNNIEFSSHDGVLYDKEATVLIQCPSGKNGNYIIPDSTVVIGENGFAGCDKLDSISVSDNIRIIGQWAFYDCKEGVKIHWSSESLGDDEFHLNYGYAVTKDWFNKAIAISFGNRIETVPKNLFRGCTNISTVNIHLNIKEIGIRAFDNCNSITDVYYQGTTKQWESILINSDNLPILDAVIHCSDGIYEYEYTPSQKFEFSDGVIIGYLSNDSHVSIPETINGIKVIAIGENAFSDNTNLQGVTIPDTVTSIGSYAFAGCTKLESVYLPDSVTDISDGAFAGCTALFEIELPDKITGIKTRLFANCKALKKIVIPKSVTTIYTYAFYGCEKLEKIVMSDDVTYIQDSAFENCSELTSIVLSKKLRSIGTSAFFGCTGLTSVIIPESVSEIKREAFYGCEKLKSVAIPENIISIGENAFGKCAGLEDVYFKGTLEKWNMIYSIDSGNDNLLNAELHCCAEILEPPIMYLSKTRIAASGITGTCKLILASYRGSNMIDLKIIPISENTTFFISETGIKTTGATLIKSYLWKATDSINPVCGEESTPF